MQYLDQSPPAENREQSPPESWLLSLAQRLPGLWAAHGSGGAASSEAEIEAVEALISATQAATPIDACVQILMALPLADWLVDADQRDRARRLLWSALHAVARSEGVDLAAIGGNIYAPPHADPWRDQSVEDYFAGVAKLAAAGAALPIEATDAMVDAGARSCHISTAAARRLWNVMAVAFAHEAGGLRT